MKMKKSIVLFSLIVFNMKMVYSSSFCTDPDDYECKHLGISKCVPKLNRSTTQKPLPIEKPPCAVPCLNTNSSWCEERGACINKDEHCDCGPDKIYCTSEDAYSCESRKGILQSHIFNICRNGECRKNCTMAEEEGTEGCEEGQFMCGGLCLDTVKVVQNRTCNKHCISVHKTCYAKQEEVSVVINDSGRTDNIYVIDSEKTDSIYVICLCVILVLFGVNCFLCYKVQSNSKQIQYLKNTTTDHKNVGSDSDEDFQLNSDHKNVGSDSNEDFQLNSDHKNVGSDSDEDFQLNSDFHAVYLPL